MSNGSILRDEAALGVAIGTLTAVAFGAGGFFLVNDNYGAMGSVLFLLLPFATGFATALVSHGKKLIAAALLIGLIICTALLLATGQEGWVCVLMSMPLIIVGLTIGAIFGVIIRRHIIDKGQKPRVATLSLLLVIPFFLMGANRAEEGHGELPVPRQCRIY